MRSKITPIAVYYALLAFWLLNTAMHIPDGYLSPATDLIMALIALPFWIRGIRKLRQAANARNIPVIALFAALSFVIMMFNVPLPGGTTGHAVGGALAAIILGPEIASIAITIALVIQAFFFGDGGVLALGANAFNMAIVLPYVSYSVYQWLSKDSPLGARRRIAASAVAGWAGLTLAAFFAGVEFGIQPLLFHTAAGVPLYAPYPLNIAIPAMVIPHALVASIIEGGLTALVIAYLQRANRPALAIYKNPGYQAAKNGPGHLKLLWIALAGLVVAAPMGLLAPGTAWGEWTAEELTSNGLGFIPQGMARLSEIWGAPLSGYDLASLNNPALGYTLSAVIGVLLVVFMAWLFATLFSSGKSEKF